MPSLKDLKNRIDSVRSTRKITKAMQMVAAAKLRRAQDAAESARPYAERMRAVMSGLAGSVGGRDGAPRLLAGTGSDQVQLLVVMTSERGLCGAFNSSIVRAAKHRIETLLGAGKTVKIITVGKKGREQLKREYSQHFIAHVDMSEVKRVGYDNAAGIAGGVMDRFAAGEFDVCTIFYNRFVSVITQEPQVKQIIPAVFDQPGEDTSDGTPYEYEPGEEGVLVELLPRGVSTEIFTALLENGASEEGARMTAMDNATRNAGEMIDKLTIE
ncbi:F0F1 ATP synthase subunit gamma, partial [Tropicimonas sp.]|uniref:F0F1 ATP synthase subunit gamma n=1 Tax=Tropicimonas sp. TaxID=2067044 RepID=UPI003A88B70D